MKNEPCFREIARIDPRLAPLVFSFNFHPALYVHPSYLQGDQPVPWLDWLRRSERGLRRLSGVLLRRTGLQGRYCFDFARPQRRVVLLPPEVLRDLLLRAGAVWWSPVISRAVVRTEQEQMRKALGEDLYQFSLKRAPLFLTDRPDLDLPACLPDEKTEAFLIETGRLCLERCLAGEIREVTVRFAFKFPREWPWKFEAKVSPWQQTQAWNFLRRILCREAAADWAPCFN